MYKSKFFEILSTFNKKQIIELGKQIQYTEDNNLTKLFNYVSKFLIEKKEDLNLNREHIRVNIYNNTIDEKKFQKLLNEGVKFCEWIILKQSIESDKNMLNLILSDYYQKNNLDKYFLQQKQLLHDELDSTKESSSSYYFKYRLEHLSIEQELKSNMRNSNYSNLITFLNTYTEIENLKIKCISMTKLHDDLQKVSIDSLLHKHYLHCYNMLNSMHLESFSSCWNDLCRDAAQISDIDLKVILSIYYNICINQLNKNHVEFYEHLLNAYMFSLDNGIAFEENGLLLPSHFKNIVTISLRLGKLDFAHKFVTDYKNYLPEDDKEDVYNYNMAHIYFYQKKFEDVLSLLVKSKFTDVFYKLSSRVLQIKTYAEFTLQNAKYEDVLESSLNAFKKYIYTNKEINETYAINYKNFYKVLNKIISITKNDYEAYSNEIKQLKPLPEVEWLLSFMKRRATTVSR